LEGWVSFPNQNCFGRTIRQLRLRRVGLSKITKPVSVAGVAPKAAGIFKTIEMTGRGSKLVGEGSAGRLGSENPVGPSMTVTGQENVFVNKNSCAFQKSGGSQTNSKHRLWQWLGARHPLNANNNPVKKKRGGGEGITKKGQKTEARPLSKGNRAGTIKRASGATKKRV